MADIDNFRQLLQYFVAHLEFCYANYLKKWDGESAPSETSTRGYKMFLDNNSWNANWGNFYRTGQGYKNGGIQKQITAWEKYSSRKICISIGAGSRNRYKDFKLNYLHWYNTYFAIRANWNSSTNTISELFITKEQKEYKPIATLSVVDNLYDSSNNAISVNTKDLEYFWNIFSRLLTSSSTMVAPSSSTIPLATHSVSSSCPTAPPHPLNLILYGPPGTGKTYNTVNRALEIIDGEIPSDREDAKKRYDELVEKGQIVFTTFHQSMSYEDFIEGIKPIPVDGDIIAIHKNEQAKTTPTQFGDGTTTISNLSRMKYEVRDGIFKKMCEKAKEKEGADILKCIDEFINAIAGEKKKEIVSTISGKSFFYVWKNKVSDVTLRVQSVISKAETSPTNINIEKLKLQAVGDGIENNWTQYATAIINHVKKKYQAQLEDFNSKVPYVLIIDEINRGNVAQIFGELITLIEESKRLGNSESMTATLPYSQEKFGVPNNLYIIGTMNTADRSVEALDTALRRRFSFEEMMPKPELLKGKNVCDVDLGELLDTINKRIVALKDREHQIGHSYFMGVGTESDLKNVFKDKIIPLLQEYFYGDYKKIYYVLGPGFVTITEDKPENIFSVNIDDDFDVDILEKTYEIKTIDESFEIVDAIKKLIGENNDEDDSKSEEIGGEEKSESEGSTPISEVETPTEEKS